VLPHLPRRRDQNSDENAIPHPIEDPQQNRFTDQNCVTDPDRNQNRNSDQDRHSQQNKHSIAHTNPECDSDSKWRNDHCI
jgi:hypothetical protein